MTVLSLLLIALVIIFCLTGLWCILNMPEGMPKSFTIHPLTQEELDKNK